MEKVLIFGAGWLGHRYRDYFEMQGGYKVTLSNANISNRRTVELIMDSLGPDVVINTAGKTGRPNIDWCDTHKAETIISNVVGPIVLSSCCSVRNIYFVHLSSGCIFNGPSPGLNGWTEEDKPNPVSYYAETKVVSDEIVQQYPSLILRIRMPIDKYPNPRNLISKLANYSKLINIMNSVTVVDDLLCATLKLIHVRNKGIYNVVNERPVTHQEIMDEYIRLVDPTYFYKPISLDELYNQKLATAGRSNCILDTSKLKKAGIVLTETMDSVCQCLEEYRRHI